jgi:hypothetical protein
MKATGEFDVDLQPLDPHTEGKEGMSFTRMAIDKTFRGDLAATSKGEMLTVTTAVEGSAAYVALEQVNGQLQGQNGTFVLQHYGVMGGSDNRLILEVVPDSGTAQLAGLSGKMTIKIEDDKHLYEFDYSLD